MNEELQEDEIIEHLDMENRSLRKEKMDLFNSTYSQNFNEQDDQNLIYYQLETDKILERIEHFLKGDQIKFGNGGVYYSSPVKKVLVNIKQDSKTGVVYFIQELKENKKGTEYLKEILVKIKNKNGEEIDISEEDNKLIMDKLKKIKLTEIGYDYVEINDENKKPFNEYGVAEIMRIISMYITKETFLSYYDEDRINEILGDLGDSLNDFLYSNYEKMGMDTKFKESKYILICENLLHSIESCYRRALGGNEQEFLRTRSIVTQNQNSITPNNQMVNKNNSKKWHPLKPSTW